MGRRKRTDESPPRTYRAARAYGIGALLALLAWALVGDAWWTMPLNLATFWWSLPGLLLLPVALLARRGRIVLTLALPAAIWLWSYGALFVPGGGVDAEPDLRLATFNTYVGAEGTEHVEALIATAAPDVLVLEEVFPDREEILHHAHEQDYPHQWALQSPGVGGVMVLSRFPILEVRPVGDATEASRSTAVVVLDVDGRRVQVVPVHLTSPCPTCSPSPTARLNHEAEARQAEVAAILRALLPGVPAIVAGDLNSNERSGPYRALTRAGFADPHREAGSGPGFTWPNDGPVGALLRIDWVFTRQLDAIDAWVGDGGVSDHRPVIVDVGFPDPRNR